MAIRVSLGGRDNASIRFLKQWPRGFYISPLVDCFDDDLQEFLTKQYFQNGAALFGRETRDELKRIREWACGYLDTVPDDEVALIAQYFVQRVRNYVHLEHLANAGILFARVEAMPHAQQCRHHDRGLVRVVDSVERLQWFKTMSLLEYSQIVFGKNHGFPPYKIDCSCRMEGIIPGLD